MVAVAGVLCWGSSVGDRVLPGSFLFGWVRDGALRLFVITTDQRRRVWLYKLKFFLRIYTPQRHINAASSTSSQGPAISFKSPGHVTTIKLVASVLSLCASL